LKNDNLIILGDFNSNAIWDNDSPKEYTHSDMIDILEKHEFISVYHSLNDEQHGKEKTPTLYFRKNPDIGYHIDYIFLKRTQLDNVRELSIGDYDR